MINITSNAKTKITDLLMEENNPKLALILGEIKIPPIGKPFPIPLAIEIIFGFMS